MKKFIVLIHVLILFICCTNDDKDFSLLVSAYELELSANREEQIVKISSVADWDCEYSAEWLLVRQQQDKIRVIVDENPSREVRSDVIRIKVNGAIKAEITVTQRGTALAIENKVLTIDSNSEDITIPVSCNNQWTFKNPLSWCSAYKNEDNIFLTVERNYSMNERSGIITINSGEVSLDITISQSGCQWFESFEMIKVEGGAFYMGAQKNSSEEDNYDAYAYQIESPVHKVSVSSYAIGKFEVTQAQWSAAMGNNPSNIQGENLPVENVTWEDVQSFISVLNEKSGLNYRLPTEAEWEFAAKGGNMSNAFYYSGNPVLGACGWFYSNSKATTHEVGTKFPNELGIYDMSGNVREWCNDWFKYYSSSDEENPQGASDGSTKVNRGGSWTTPASNCRNTYRHTDYPHESALDLGFRLVLSY